MPAGDLRLCGWRVASDIPLPELLPWDGDDGAPDVEVRLGAVADAIADPVHRGPLLQIGADGSCRYAIAGVAAFHVDASGRTVTVTPEIEPDAPDLRLFLFGSVFGLLCYKRGVLPLHAACVVVDGRAVALSGPSGVGKSTLAAALCRDGALLLSDDVTAVELAPAGGAARVWPSFPRQKLWRDTLEALALPIGRALRPRARAMEKFDHPVAGFQAQPLPLAAICHVREERLAGRAPVVALDGLQAVTVSMTDLYCRPAGEVLLGIDGMFRAATALAGAAAHFTLRRPALFAELPEFAAHLPDRLRQELR